MGTQTKIARTIRERGAHDALCVKNKPSNLYDSIRVADHDSQAPLSPSSTHGTTSTDHGRTEVRRCRAHAVTDRLYEAQD